jgi:hypothetical protein
VENRDCDATQYNALKQRYPDRVHHIEGETRNVHSEMIREALKECQASEQEKIQKIVKFVELEEVAKYIVKHNLWETSEKVKIKFHCSIVNVRFPF